MKVTVRSIFRYSHEKVWRLLQKTETLQQITGGQMFEYLPEYWEQGTQIFTEVMISGKPTPWEIFVERVDHDMLTIITREHGGPIEHWVHTMQIKRIDHLSCYYIDEIDVEAQGSLLTNLALRLWVKNYYIKRHANWIILLEDQ